MSLPVTKDYQWEANGQIHPSSKCNTNKSISFPSLTWVGLCLNPLLTMIIWWMNLIALYAQISNLHNQQMNTYDLRPEWKRRNIQTYITVYLHFSNHVTEISNHKCLCHRNCLCHPSQSICPAPSLLTSVGSYQIRADFYTWKWSHPALGSMSVLIDGSLMKMNEWLPRWALAQTLLSIHLVTLVKDPDQWR